MKHCITKPILQTDRLCDNYLAPSKTLDHSLCITLFCFKETVYDFQNNKLSDLPMYNTIKYGRDLQSTSLDYRT